MSSPSLSEVIRTLADENQKRRSTRLVINWIFGGGIVLLLVLYGLNYLKSGQVPDWSGIAPFLALVGAGAAFSATHKDALKKASQFANKESAGFLLEAYSTTDERDIREVCLTALPGSLDDIDSADNLDAYQRSLLYKILNAKSPKVLVAAALRCIHRTSGKEAIPYLEQFKTAAQKHKDPEWNKLGGRALEALPDVRIRVARELIERRIHSDAEVPLRILS